jgi:hypothetical protein
MKASLLLWMERQMCRNATSFTRGGSARTDETTKFGLEWLGQRKWGRSQLTWIAIAEWLLKQKAGSALQSIAGAHQSMNFWRRKKQKKRHQSPLSCSHPFGVGEHEQSWTTRQTHHSSQWTWRAPRCNKSKQVILSKCFGQEKEWERVFSVSHSQSHRKWMRRVHQATERQSVASKSIAAANFHQKRKAECPVADLHFEMNRQQKKAK